MAREDSAFQAMPHFSKIGCTRQSMISFSLPMPLAMLLQGLKIANAKNYSYTNSSVLYCTD